MRREFWPFWCMLAFLLAGPAAAQSSDTGGIGGTGIGPETGGIGGTGIHPETGGIGGTGIKPQGKPVLGYGPIQAFGSVFVNGREYRIDGRTLISVDGNPATAASLRVGDIAQVRGIITGPRQGHADMISVIHPVIGPISSASADGREAVILGQKLVSAAPIFSGLQTGEAVAISAQRRADGSWVANNAVAVPGAAAQLTGAAGDNQAGPTVAGTSVQLPPGTTAPAPGTMVLVRGTATPSSLLVSSVAAAPSLIAPPGTRVEVQDYFRKSDGVTRAADGLEVQNFPDSDVLTGMTPTMIEGELVAPNVVDLDLAGEEGANLPQAPSVTEPPEAPEPGLEPSEVTPDLPGEPPEIPDLDDK
jgi:hypothetical protein